MDLAFKNSKSSIFSSISFQLQTLLPNATRICDAYETRCFTAYAQSNITYKSATCHCYPSCDAMQIDYATASLSNLFMADFCEDDTEHGWKYVDAFLANISRNSLHDAMQENGLESVMIGRNFSDNVEVCNFVAENDMSYIIIGLAKSKGMRILQDVRVGFEDRVATIGGTLGLFTGMSLLSMVEVLFYFWQLVNTWLRSLSATRVPPPAGH